ncbi:MAG: NAD-dependent epimerase/dehydratase family protein [Candidatus Acidiferrum sp.]
MSTKVTGAPHEAAGHVRSGVPSKSFLGDDGKRRGMLLVETFAREGFGDRKQWLVGSGAVTHFDAQGHEVVGVDNNMRRVFFGPAGDTLWNLERLKASTKRFEHAQLDIRDRAGIEELFTTHKFDLIVHCAAQPSHDKARDIPLLDFEVNALGTINLLESTRQHCPDAVFVLFSTNKVYGDAPNEIPMKELETRWEYAGPEDYDGVDETCRIDRTLHSLFGASKADADLVAQEYGRYFGMKVGVFRGGCLTGPSHSGVELHVVRGEDWRNRR